MQYRSLPRSASIAAAWVVWRLGRHVNGRRTTKWARSLRATATCAIDSKKRKKRFKLEGEFRWHTSH